MACGIPSPDSRTVQRLRRRQERLLSRGDAYKAARDACLRCKPILRKFPESINIRESFILSRGTNPETQKAEDSPASSLITPRGVALQIYLLGIFEAQCRTRSETSPHNDRPIVSFNKGTLGWLDLIASESLAATFPVTKRDNLLRQFKRGLIHLEKERLVALPGNRNTNGRFEFFRLLDETGSLSDAGTEIPYVIPSEPYSAADLMTMRMENREIPPRDPVISLPVDFFLRGWVHVLTAAEIVTYLMLHDLATNRYDPSEGIFVCAEPREREYGISRDVYESHRLLCLYGLVQRVSNGNRRDDGTVKSFKVDGNPLEPHRFKVPSEALKRPAFEVIVKSLDDPMAAFAYTSSDEDEFMQLLISTLRTMRS